MVQKIRVLKTSEKSQIPTKATLGAAGFDLYSIEENYLLKPGEIKLFSVGIKIAIPGGFFGYIRPRSGLASKHGIVTSSSNVVDSDYRGEVFVTLINNGTLAYEIKRGDRIGQMLILPVIDAYFDQVDFLDNTDRGEGGYGHTGR